MSFTQVPNLLEKLAHKLHYKMSWKAWEAQQKLHKEPSYRKHMQAIYNRLIVTPSQSLETLKGACISSTHLLDTLLQEYVDSDALFPNSNKPTTTLGIKMSLDGTILHGDKMEGVYLSLIVVDSMQSTRHQAIIALAMITENNPNLRQLAKEANIHELFPHINTLTININNELYALLLFLTSDWITHCNEIGIREPQLAKDDEIGCAFCGILMGELRHHWWRDPFKRHHCCTSITDYPNAVFPQLSIEQRRYCMMHASNANLSNTLTNIYNLLPSNSPKRTQLKNLLRTLCPNWKPKKFLECKDTKHFFNTNFQNQILEIFATYHVHYDLPLPNTDERVVLTAYETLALLLDCLHFFHQFAYTKWRTPNGHTSSESAREGTLAVQAGMQWRMRPTMHYTTNEGLEFAKIDGTQYFTLNEGPENEHSQVKQLAKNTMKNIPTPHTAKTTFMKIIDDQQAMQILRQNNYAPPTYQLTKINPPVPTPLAADITPPKKLPRTTQQ